MLRRDDPHLVGRRYKLHRLLGRGGMGAVFQAVDRLTGNQIAIKRVYAPKQLASGNQDMDAETMRLGLAQEFKTLASLWHPGIINVIDYGFDKEKQPYFAMELLENAHSLGEAVRGLSEAEISDVVIQLLQALAYLHRRDVIHRDLKPSNIMMVDRRVKVLDFGLSLMREDISKQDVSVAGTLEYMAPELFQGKPPSISSDLYAVGTIAYELFKGEALFTGADTGAILRKIVFTKPDINLDNEELAAVIRKLVAKQPKGRYQNADEVIIAISRACHLPLPEETIEIRESFLQAARFVGRDTELNLLLEQLQKAMQGEGGIWLIDGESGVGKTRLLEEVRTRALVNGVLVLHGQSQKEARIPYQLWQHVLRWLCLISDIDRSDASSLKEVVPDIETLLEQKVPDAPEIHSLMAMERLLIAIEKLFVQQSQPILLVLEDLHWSGVESLNVLNRLKPMFKRLPILVMCSYRGDDAPNMQGRVPGVNYLRLERLSGDSVAELSAAMLGKAGRRADIIELLQRETEGNVFFVVEVVRALAQEAGKLDRITDMTLPEQIFAGGIEEVIRRRLNRIPAMVREVLQYAATIGRQFDLKLLERACDPDTLELRGWLERWLMLCVDAAVLTKVEGHWQFAHDKLREGVLADVQASEVSRLHRRVAEAIEAVYFHSSMYTISLAYHWGRAGDRQKHAHYAALAGKQALTSGAYEDSLTYLNAALEYDKSTIADEDDEDLPGRMQQHGNLVRMMGEATEGLGDYKKAEDIYLQCLDIYRKVDYKWGMTMVLNNLGNVNCTKKNWLAAWRYYRDALEIAMERRAQQNALASILGMATVMAEHGRESQAVELATMVFQHMRTDKQTVDRAGVLLERLEKIVSEEAFEAARIKGEEKSLKEIVLEIMNIRD